MELPAWFAEFFEEPSWLAIGFATEIDPSEGCTTVQLQDVEGPLTVGEMHVQDAELEHRGILFFFVL